MRTYLLPENGTFYKANLHCHTNMSDGTLSPEEMKKVYMEHGYSIIAYTDHELLFPQNHLTEENFLALNGVEQDIDEKALFDRTGKKIHFCCIALEPDQFLTPYPNKGMLYGAIYENSRLAKAYPGTETFQRTYSPECISFMMKSIRDMGFFVTYNHPDWSLEDQADFCQYDGMNAMEICNYACICMGFEEYNPKAYDAMLRRGKRIFCTANDDNHNRPDRTWDSFGGFTVIKADKLEYRTITKALEDGHFYASQGPEIHDLYLEDDTIHITCSPAEQIVFTTAQRHRQRLAAEEGSSLTEGSFELAADDGYVRVTVIDHRGRPANTNAYFLDTLPFTRTI